MGQCHEKSMAFYHMRCFLDPLSKLLTVVGTLEIDSFSDIKIGFGAALSPRMLGCC